jgi:glucose-6-phosphate isomerase
MIRVDYKYTNVEKNVIDSYLNGVNEKANQIFKKTGKGNDFLGWVDYLRKLDSSVIDKIKDISSEIKKNADVLIVVGIGGSYLGSKAVIESFANSFTGTVNGGVKVIFAGQNLSSLYMDELLDEIKDKSVYVNVISKSGTTTEPAIAFRIIKKFMEEKYGEDSSNRIIATTDISKGALRSLSDIKGYRTFIIPDDVGGRYSVLTPVGLLPIAASGIDLDEFILGLNQGMDEYSSPSLEDNEAFKYAVLRNILLSKGKSVELLVSYEPKLSYLSEWFKQLYGESEGKENKGIFPASVQFSADLHSLGQYIQQGQRFLFETVLDFNITKGESLINSDIEDLDGLNYISGQSIDYVKKMAIKGTILAHYDGDVPIIRLQMDELNVRTLGKLMYFFMIGCAMSGYILDVNPFDQPGVEDYKKNMFALLGKKGYEELRKALLENE